MLVSRYQIVKYLMWFYVVLAEPVGHKKFTFHKRWEKVCKCKNPKCSAESEKRDIKICWHWAVNKTEIFHPTHIGFGIHSTWKNRQPQIHMKKDSFWSRELWMQWRKKVSPLDCVNRFEQQKWQRPALFKLCFQML